MAEYQPVVFENSEGTEISNDPNWLAMKQLENAGISFAGSQPNVLEAQLQAAANAGADDDEELGEDDDDETVDYTKMNGKQLKAVAAERGVDIKGIKTVGELRAALVADDEAKAENDDESDDE